MNSVDNKTEIVYNKAMQTVSSTDENGKTTKYTYDSRYRVKTETASDKSVEYEYDSNGNVVKQLINRIVHNTKIDYADYFGSIARAGIKYVIRHRIRVRIDNAVEKRIEQRLPYVLQLIAKYAYEKVKKLYFGSLSYNSIKRTISYFTTSLWNYSQNKLISAIKH